MKKSELIEEIRKIDPEIEGLESMTVAKLNALLRSLTVSDDSDKDSETLEIVQRKGSLFLQVNEYFYELPFKVGVQNFAKECIREFHNQKNLAKGSKKEDEMLSNIDKSFYSRFAKTVIEETEVHNEGFKMALARKASRDELLQFGLANLQMIYKTYIQKYNLKERY